MTLPVIKSDHVCPCPLLLSSVHQSLGTFLILCRGILQCDHYGNFYSCYYNKTPRQQHDCPKAYFPDASFKTQFFLHLFYYNSEINSITGFI